MTMKIDRKFFYANIRSSLFGRLSEKQVEGMDAILDQIEEANLNNNGYAAYILATSYHETGGTMQPVRENLYYSAKRIREVWPTRFASVADAKPYAQNPEKLANKVYSGRYGNGGEASGDGYRYSGKGQAQVTFKDNYAKVSKIVGIDLVAEPDKMLDLKVSAIALVQGMINGTYRGKKLANYNSVDYIPMRKIINADGNGAKIAGYAKKFYAAIKWTTLPDDDGEATDVAVAERDKVLETMSSIGYTPPSIWASISAWFQSLFANKEK